MFVAHYSTVYTASGPMHRTACPLVFVQQVLVKSLSTENEGLKKSVR